MNYLDEFYNTIDEEKRLLSRHGRVEYLSAMVISFLVLYAGITAFVESVKKIITPASINRVFPAP